MIRVYFVVVFLLGFAVSSDAGLFRRRCCANTYHPPSYSVPTVEAKPVAEAKPHVEATPHRILPRDSCPPTQPKPSPSNPPLFDFAEDETDADSALTDTISDAVASAVDGADTGHTILAVLFLWLYYRKREPQTIDEVLAQYRATKKRIDALTAAEPKQESKWAS